MDEIKTYLNENKFIIERSKNNRIVKLLDRDKFFETLHTELITLSKAYNKSLNDIHVLFMELCCDIHDLKRYL